MEHLNQCRGDTRQGLCTRVTQVGGALASSSLGVEGPNDVFLEIDEGSEGAIEPIVHETFELRVSELTSGKRPCNENV